MVETFFLWTGILFWLAVGASYAVVLIADMLPDEPPDEEVEYEHPIGH